MNRRTFIKWLAALSVLGWGVEKTLAKKSAAGVLKWTHPVSILSDEELAEHVVTVPPLYFMGVDPGTKDAALFAITKDGIVQMPESRNVTVRLESEWMKYRIPEDVMNEPPKHVTANEIRQLQKHVDSELRRML